MTFLLTMSISMAKVTGNTGVFRCSKSCRLRWAHHLRPNLKKGASSQDEEHLRRLTHAKLMALSSSWLKAFSSSQRTYACQVDGRLWLGICMTDKELL